MIEDPRLINELYLVVMTIVMIIVQAQRMHASDNLTNIFKE